MARPQKFNVPFNRPETCSDCPLLGKKPIDEVPYGSKWTHKCFLPGHEHDLAGRTISTSGMRNRVRCKPKEWEKTWVTYNGTISISRVIVEKYHLESKLPFESMYEKSKKDAR